MCKKSIIFLLFSFFFIHLVEAQEILLPLVSNVKDKVLFQQDNKYLVSDGFFPVSYKEAQSSLPEKDTLKTRNWIYRKVFKEHFVQQQGKSFFLAIDPVIDMRLGQTHPQDTSFLFRNVKGAQAFGEIGGIFSFYTAFYENQARFMEQESAYFRSRGELYPNDGGYYQMNAVVPNGGRTKPFKGDAFDYSSAISYVRLTPLKQLAVQFGNAPRFLGWGYRSLLLSDNSNNYTHLSIDWKITPQLSYTLIRGKQLNLIRKRYTDFVEAPYERKGIGMHYLSYQPLPSLVLGVFESTIYLRDEATSYQRVNSLFYQPVIGLNTVVKGAESKDMKNLLGLNLAWKFHVQHLLYAQVVSDNFSLKAYGFQMGYRGGNLFKVENLNFQLELNKASSYLYSANNSRMEYSHFNLPLAHTLGNAFTEVVVRANYLWKGLFVDGGVVYYRTQETPLNMMAIFQHDLTHLPVFSKEVINGHLELGYEFNPATHLRAFIRVDYRREEGFNPRSIRAVNVGIRSTLRNQYFDF